MRQLGRKIGAVAIGVAVLAGATVIAANLFPDQVYALLHTTKERIGNPAAGTSQRHPAEQGNSGAVKSSTTRFVLLPETGAGLSLCSRRGPKVDGTWKVTEQDITALESNLKRISSLRSAGSLKGITIAHPEECYRQYIPVVIAGRKLIYVNAFCHIEVPDWRTQFVTICDGGESAWGVLYDPATEEFSDLEVNGVA